MRIVSAAELAGVLTFPELIEALREAFRQGAVMPTRHHHTIALSGEPDATLLLMPAWNDLSGERTGQEFLGVKIVSIYPGNAARRRASVSGTYLLMAGATGEVLAVIDAGPLTLWRTAAASALAASYLARQDASRLLMVGAGALAPYLIAAHASGRPIREVQVWNRHFARAAELVTGLTDGPYAVTATRDLEEAVRSADIISCATLSSEPLVRGDWLRPGAHLDLVGAFTPAMRESDDAAVRRSRIYVDTRAGALQEAGDLLLPMQGRVMRELDVVADLFDLCRGDVEGRRSDSEITLFKSVGAALEDLAAAVLAFRALERIA